MYTHSNTSGGNRQDTPQDEMARLRAALAAAERRAEAAEGELRLARLTIEKYQRDALVHQRDCDILTHPTLHEGTKVVMMALNRAMDARFHEDPHHHERMTYADIGDFCSMSDSSVGDHVRALDKMGWIEKRQERIMHRRNEVDPQTGRVVSKREFEQYVTIARGRLWDDIAALAPEKPKNGHGGVRERKVCPECHSINIVERTTVAYICRDCGTPLAVEVHECDANPPEEPEEPPVDNDVKPLPVPAPAPAPAPEPAEIPAPIPFPLPAPVPTPLPQAAKPLSRVVMNGQTCPSCAAPLHVFYADGSIRCPSCAHIPLTD